MKDTKIIMLVEGDYMNYYRAVMEIGGEQFVSTSHKTVAEWKEILGHDLEGIPIKDR